MLWRVLHRRAYLCPLIPVFGQFKIGARRCRGRLWRQGYSAVPRCLRPAPVCRSRLTFPIWCHRRCWCRGGDGGGGTFVGGGDARPHRGVSLSSSPLLPHRCPSIKYLFYWLKTRIRLTQSHADIRLSVASEGGSYNQQSTNSDKDNKETQWKHGDQC